VVRWVGGGRRTGRGRRGRAIGDAGLRGAEIARAFLVSEPTLSQRLPRARRKISNARIPDRVPPDELLAERTSGVLAVDEARCAYLAALQLAPAGRPEQRLLQRRLSGLSTTR
jgi:RNA polymerase sigma-70 factor, ECF subfamily